jgi:hypothetical protein
MGFIRGVRYWLGAILLVGALPVGLSAFPSGKARSVEMNASGATSEILSADLFPFVEEKDVSMVLARVVTVRSARQRQEDLETDVGVVTFEVAEVIYSNTVTQGVAIAVPMMRVADPAIRARNSQNQWNNLFLKAGNLVVLACRPMGHQGACQGLGAIPVDTVASPIIGAMRKCYAIEHFRGQAQQRTGLITEALVSPEAQLRYYALDLLGRRALLGREGGAELIMRAMASNNASPDDEADLGDFLTRLYFYDPDRKADPTNVAIVSMLARELVSETDRERRFNWLRLLASCVLGEFSAQAAADRAARNTLVGSVRSPSPQEVINALSSAYNEAADDEKGIIAELRNAWVDASRG